MSSDTQRIAQAMWAAGTTCDPLPEWPDLQLPPWIRRRPDASPEMLARAGVKDIVSQPLLDRLKIGLHVGGGLEIDFMRLMIKLPLEGECVTDLLLDDGASLAGLGGPPLAAQDPLLSRLVEQTGLLVLTHTLADVALFVTLGVPAVHRGWIINSTLDQWEQWVACSGRKLPELILPGDSIAFTFCDKFRPSWPVGTICGMLLESNIRRKPYFAELDFRHRAFVAELQKRHRFGDRDWLLRHLRTASSPCEWIGPRKPGDGVDDRPKQLEILTPRDFQTIEVGGSPRRATLRITRLGAVRSVPAQISCPGIRPTGREAAVWNDSLVDVPVGMKAAAYDRPAQAGPKQMAMAMGAVPKAAVEATTCDEEIVRAEALLLDPAATGGAEPLAVACYMPAAIAPCQVGECLAEVSVVMHAARRERVAWVHRITPRPVAYRRYLLRPDQMEDALRPFEVPADSLAGLIAPARRLSAWVCRELGCGGGWPVQLRALLGLLVHTSPRSILLPGGRRIIGSASTLIIGPSGVGKTTVLAGLTERIDFGEIVAGEAMSRAGLLYAISGGHVRPGALPRNHGGLVLADELHKDTDNCLAEATSGRSSGLLRISMSVRAELPMNTRLIAIGNLRLRGQRGAGGGLSLALNDLEFPILGAGFLEAEDLRRFDIVAVAGPIDPLVGLVGPSEPSTFTWDGLRSLIATAWDLDVDDPATFDWPDGTVEELRAQVGRLNRWYICEQVPLFGAVTFEKLARLSCAAARLLPVQLDRLVHVTAAHVRFVAWLLHQVYRPAVNGLRRLARLERQIVTAPNEQILEGLMLAVRRIDQGEQLARILASRQYVPVRDMAALTGFSAPTIYTRLREFKQLDLARSHGRNGFAATTLLIQLVVRMGQLPVPG